MRSSARASAYSAALLDLKGETDCCGMSMRPERSPARAEEGAMLEFGGGLFPFDGDGVTAGWVDAANLVWELFRIAGKRSDANLLAASLLNNERNHKTSGRNKCKRIHTRHVEQAFLQI